MKKEDWVNIEERLPPKSKTPFHSYLVWLRGSQGKVEHGICYVASFSADFNKFMHPSGDDSGLIITHWAEVPNPITGET